MPDASTPSGAPQAGLRTPRLLLRPWRPDDLAPFAELNADPEVTAHFPAPLDRAASDALAARVAGLIEEQGWGLWAVEVVATGAFVGFTGLSRPAFEASFTPAVEVGWRLARSAWGHGYATEAATAALDFAFDGLGLTEVVSFTAADNRRSVAVMERLGMTHDPRGTFDHPRLPADDPLRRHVLYRVTAERWRDGRRGAREG
ncbi:GNAT family N-acetyltransferase [Streptomyces daliensis]|uniref:GNAT family N-acetyltransferase n=1 Tax=Streptomyces daliensis TaxID=299421 RepID=A0A8T4IK19_9ACTN|nr:GNAT family N-acetyltransferase [Streptomyces daliensis]